VVLKDLELKIAYDSDADDILNDFYVKALSESIKYKRIAGFFSSKSLALAARGMSKFISNGGKMELICSVKLTESDAQVIIEAEEEPEKVLERIMVEDLKQVDEGFIKEHLSALGWMIAKGNLQIKVAIVLDENENPIGGERAIREGLFHQKVGILEDKNGDEVSFSGSDNETATAWSKHIEEFKVFFSWDNTSSEYLDEDRKRFEKFWNGLGKRTIIMDVPSAVKAELILKAPENIDSLDLLSWYKEKSKKKKIELFDHQKSAVEKWMNNDMQGIFEMATGTGKTFTALQCLKNVIEISPKLVAVITCPYHHLITQWDKNINYFGIDTKRIIADSTNPNWRKQIVNYVLDIRNGIRDKLIILTSHPTFASTDFSNIIEKYLSGKGIDLFLIADEVHGVGAEKRKLGLLEQYKYRLGLSATPKRWFDELGTQALYDFFNQVVYSFSLKDAIYTVNPDTGKTYLTPFEYKPIFVELSEDEIDSYIKETEKITKSYHSSRSEEEKEEILKLLLFKRANIIKNAQNKIPVLVQILKQLKEIKHTIIYCSPQQIETVRDLLREKNILFHKFTNEEGTNPEMVYGGLSERDYLLEKFADGDYKVLVAMRCLDEGVDIPPARIAIFMASSGNPREYIQRIGRVLRRFPNKEKAIIFDIIVIPTMKRLVSDYSEIEWKIIQNEIKRYEEIAGASLNVAEVYDELDKIIKRIKR